MRVLVVGSGGREHALAWALARSQQVEQVYVAPGNAGTQWSAYADAEGRQHASSINVPISAVDIPALLVFAQEQRIDLTVVGPEVPLSMGIVDLFQAAGLRIFGPTKAAAQLEASKAFAKEFMRENGIPTADFSVFDNYENACRYIDAQDCPLVVKADGLAAGKGVIVCDTRDEAKAAAHQMLIEHEFGSAGDLIVIEERLTGWEVSVLAFCDGESFAIMPYVADHKRAYDGDQGPNTGGMGAYAPRLPGLGVMDIFYAALLEKVFKPALAGMRKNGSPYTGILYAGLMLHDAGNPHLLEFNCRFGDPETQVLLPLLKTDLSVIMNACMEGKLDQIDIDWSGDWCATVILASGGYPGNYQTGLPINGIGEAQRQKGVVVFHSGTTYQDNQIVTAGGRVLAVTGVGDILTKAIDRAYAAIDLIHFEGMHYRRDIGRTIRESVK